MRLIDRIALSRAIKTILDFILELVKMFVKDNDKHKPNGSVKPKTRRKPVKDLLNNILPWRK